jgi:hypothetical protein
VVVILSRSIKMSLVSGQQLLVKYRKNTLYLEVILLCVQKFTVTVSIFLLVRTVTLKVDHESVN